MTFALTRAVAETFDSNVTDNTGGFNLLGLAIGGDVEAARNFAPRQLTFSAEATHNGNDTENVANAVMRLGVLGITFPAGTTRKVLIRTWARQAAATDIGYTEKHVMVVGGATPTVRQDTTGAISAALGIPLAFEQIAAGGAYVLPVVTGEVGGVFINLRNVAAAAIQTPVNVAGGIRCRVEVLIDPLVISAAP